MRSLRWRAAIGVVGLVLVYFWVAASGRMSYVVQIDWRAGQPWLDGALVEIDGDSVGVLQPYGRSSFVTGFEVEPGEHTLKVSTDDCESREERVSLPKGGSRLAVLLADVDDGLTCRINLW